jgi:hypothetical protein
MITAVAGLLEDRPSSLIMDLTSWMRTFERVRAAASSRDLLFPGHDRLLLENYPEVAKDITRLDYSEHQNFFPKLLMLGGDPCANICEIFVAHHTFGVIRTPHPSTGSGQALRVGPHVEAPVLARGVSP